MIWQVFNNNPQSVCVSGCGSSSLYLFSAETTQEHTFNPQAQNQLNKHVRLVSLLSNTVITIISTIFSLNHKYINKTQTNLILQTGA